MVWLLSPISRWSKLCLLPLTLLPFQVVKLLLTTDGFHGAADIGLTAVIGKPRTLTAAALRRFGERLPSSDNATAVLISRGRAVAQLGRITKDTVMVTSTTEQQQR